MKYSAVVVGGIFGLLVDCNAALSARQGVEEGKARTVLQLSAPRLKERLIEVPSSSSLLAVQTSAFGPTVAANSEDFGTVLQNLIRPLERTVSKFGKIGKDRSNTTRRRGRGKPLAGPPAEAYGDLPRNVPTPLERPLISQDNVLVYPATAVPANSPVTTSWTWTGILLPLFFSLCCATVILSWSRIQRRKHNISVFAEKAIYSAIAGLSDNRASFEVQTKLVFLSMAKTYSLEFSALVAVDKSNGNLKDLIASSIESGYGDELLYVLHKYWLENKSFEGQLQEICLNNDRHYPGPLQNHKVDRFFFVQNHLDNHNALIYIGVPSQRRILEPINKQALESIAQLFTLKIDKFWRKGANYSDEVNGAASELAGRVAHEFRNVLTSITGYAEMAADAVHPGSSPHRYLEHIQKAGDRARQIIDHTLDGVRSMNGVVFDVVEATNEVFPDVKTFGPNDIDFHCKILSVPVRVKGDRLKFQQIIINLCKNAAESIIDGGTVEILVSTTHEKCQRIVSHGVLNGSYAQVSVVDTGRGIDEEHIAKISKTSFTTKITTGGTGLGLPMICDAVAEFGGALNIVSCLGVGTHVDVFIPLTEPANDDSPNHSRTAGLIPNICL